MAANGNRFGCVTGHPIISNQNALYQCSLLCEPKTQAEELQPYQSPVRLIEKWAAEESRQQRRPLGGA